jgi:hypothetical protein
LLAMSRLFNALPTADAILVSTSADAILVFALPRSGGVYRLLALRTYGHCLHRTGTRIATADDTPPYPPHPHALRYGCSGQATVYPASRIYGHCRTSRTGPREARSHRLHVAERSATEFLEILYTSTTPMNSSHCSTPHSYTPTGRKCMPSISEITVAHLLLS